jgi:hypothetical protein
VVTLEPGPWLDVEPEPWVDVEPELVLVCGVELAVEVEPSEPVPAISPKAIAKVASAPATTRRRITPTRRARARSRSRTSSELESGEGVEGMPTS